jgi:hypothetical protein
VTAPILMQVKQLHGCYLSKAPQVEDLTSWYFLWDDEVIATYSILSVENLHMAFSFWVCGMC